MPDYTWDAATLCARLIWNHGLWTVLGPLLWGGLFAVVGIAIAVGTWLLLRQRGWLDLGVSWDKWQRPAVLALSIIGSAGLLGTAGLFYGAERAVIDVLAEEQAVSHACRGASASIAVPLIREANARAGVLVDPGIIDARVQMRHVWALRESGWDALATIEDAIIREHVLVEDDGEVSSRAKSLIARWAVSRAKSEVLGGSDDRLVGYLHDLDGAARGDGTIGAEEVSAVLATKALEPVVFDGVRGLFASFRTPLYLWLLALLAFPPLVAAAVRHVRAGRAAR